MLMGLISPGRRPKLPWVAIYTIGMELSEVVSRIRLRAKERTKINRFKGKSGESIERVSRNSVREVGDNGKAVPCV